MCELPEVNALSPPDVENIAHPLNLKEQRVFELTSHGISAAEIATKEWYQPSTISNRLVDIRRKLGASSTVQAVRIGFERSILVPTIDPKLNPSYRPTLSARQLDCMFLLAEGMSDMQLANEMNISLSTVRCHVSNLRCNLLAKNRVHTVRRIIEFGILDWYSLA